MRLFLFLFFILINSFAPLNAQNKEQLIKGLQDSVNIQVDAWGVPHIYAKNEADLFFAQGYYACRDRLFQFELWRRKATGTLAEILGTREIKRDKRRSTF
jgi:penicillin G amidase